MKESLIQYNVYSYTNILRIVQKNTLKCLKLFN